jgi:hypothetical protein
VGAARRLTEYEAQFGKLREELEVATPTLTDVSESMQGTIDRVNELAGAGLSLKDSIVGWNQALEDARAPKRGGAPTMLDLFGAPMPDDILFTVPPPEISDEDRKNFFATLGELQILAESFGVKVPVEFALGRDDVTKEAIQDFVRFIEESAGLPTRLVPQNTALDEYVASADSVRDAAARTLELTERQISALSDLNGTEVARAELIRKSAGQRKRELEDFLAIKNASEEFRAVMLDLFNLGVEQDVADIFAFKDFGTEFEKAARGLTDTLDKQRVALEKNNAAIRQRAADLRAVGLITEEEAKRIEDVLGRTVEQFNEKVSKAIFSQEAFQRTDNVALMFEDIERAAKEAAIAATGITKATSEEDILKLRAAYDAAFDAMTRKSELFTRSFGAAWRDMVDDMLDMTRIGAETAAGILDGLRSAFSQSLSAFITGDEKAFEVFKELLAKSLADTIAQALTDVFVGTLADALADAFSNKVKEKLGEKVAEAGVDAALGATGAEAIGSAAGGAAEAAAEATAIASAIATTLAVELAPVIIKLTSVAGLMLNAGRGLNAAAFALTKAAIALDAAAIVLKAASTTDVATGGILSGLDAPVVKPFALGGITRPIENLQVGGIRTRETFARIAEAGTPEAVVPLPGDGRHIPVEFRGGNPAAGGNNTTIIESKVTFVIDDKSGSLRVQLQKHARDIEGIVTRALVDGSNRGMKMAVRRAANGV